MSRAGVEGDQHTGQVRRVVRFGEHAADGGHVAHAHVADSAEALREHGQHLASQWAELRLAM